MTPKYCCEVEPEIMPDFVAVVRCKDCRFDSKCKDRPLKALNDPDWYCAGGVRKEGDGE